MALRMPATPPRTEAMAKVTPITRLALMPSSPLTSGSCAVPRIARPHLDQDRNACTAAIRTRLSTRMNSCSGEICSGPKSRPASEIAVLKLKVYGPKVRRTTSSRMVLTAMVLTSGM